MRAGVHSAFFALQPLLQKSGDSDNNNSCLLSCVAHTKLIFKKCDILLATKNIRFSRDVFQPISFVIIMPLKVANVLLRKKQLLPPWIL